MAFFKHLCAIFVLIHVEDLISVKITTTKNTWVLPIEAFNWKLKPTSF